MIQTSLSVEDPSFMPTVPDASDPWLMAARRAEASRTAGARVITHRVRHAQVLAAVRRRIASEGRRGLSLGMIASDCNTTVQTLFNLAGNKSELIKAAISDHGSWLNLTAHHWKSYPVQALAFADAIWASARRNPEYVKEAAFMYNDMCRSSGGDARSAGAALVGSVLTDICEDVRTSYNISSVAGVLSSLIATTMLEWAQDGLDTGRLRTELINRVGLVVTGAVRPSKGAQIEAWLARMGAD